MGIQSLLTNEYTSSLTMKVMGLFAVTFAVCLLSMTVAQPLFFLPEAIATATFTSAGGLVLAGATGTVLATIPTSSIILGGLAAKKLALLKILAAQQEQEEA